MGEIQGYLRIARNFTPTKQGQPALSQEHIQVERAQHEATSKPDPGPPTCEKSEISEIRSDATEPAEARHILSALPYDQPGDFDHKATIPGDVPAYERVLAMQEWLAGIDWRPGLRCGVTGRQCLKCKGIPCEGSTEWPE